MGSLKITRRCHVCNKDLLLLLLLLGKLFDIVFLELINLSLFYYRLITILLYKMLLLDYVPSGSPPPPPPITLNIPMSTKKHVAHSTFTFYYVVP